MHLPCVMLLKLLLTQHMSLKVDKVDRNTNYKDAKVRIALNKLL